MPVAAAELPLETRRRANATLCARRDKGPPSKHIAAACAEAEAEAAWRRAKRGRGGYKAARQRCAGLPGRAEAKREAAWQAKAEAWRRRAECGRTWSCPKTGGTNPTHGAAGSGGAAAAIVPKHPSEPSGADAPACAEGGEKSGAADAAARGGKAGAAAEAAAHRQVGRLT